MFQLYNQKSKQVNNQENFQYINLKSFKKDNNLSTKFDIFIIRDYSPQKNPLKRQTLSSEKNFINIKLQVLHMARIIQSKLENIFFFILILFLINNQVNCVTDITYLNCPDSFDINVANTSNPSQSLVKFFFSLYDNDQHKTRVQTMVLNGDITDTAVYLQEMMLPFIGVAVAYFVFFMIVICCTVFEKSCPPCQSWRRDFNRRPYEKLELRCVMIFVIIFSTAIFILCIVMFTSFPVLKQQMQYTQCGLFNSLDITKNGDQANNWGGFAQLKNQVGNISSLLSTTSNQVNNNFKGFDGLSDDDWIIEDMQRMKTANLNIYRNNNDSKVITPNPTTTGNTPVGGILPMVPSLFISTGMGPNGTANTMTTDIDAALRKTQTLSQQAYLIQRGAMILVDSATIITANTQSSQKTLEMFQSQLDAANKNMNQIKNKYFDKFFDWGIYIIQALVGFLLAASIFVIFGTVSTHILDILICRTMVNIGWVIYGVTFFGVVGLAFIFLSGGSIAYSFCNYFDNMLTNQNDFNRIGQVSSQNPFTRLDVCLFGDGNVLKKFNIQKQMTTVTELFTNIQLYYDYENPTSVKYIDKTLSTQKIQAWIDAMQKYRLGIYLDSNPLITTDDNANYSITNLNKNTKYFNVNGTRNTSCPRDVWVFDKTNCTDPDAEVYRAIDQTNGLKFTTLNDLCISFNQELFDQGGSNIWNIRDFTLRYQQVIHDCSPAYTDIIRYGTALINYRDSRRNLFQGLKDQLSALLGLHQQFNTNLGLYKSRVDNFYSSVSTLNNLVTDKISGLLVSSDCRVVSSHLRFTNNVFCKNSLAQISILGICSILLLFFLIGAILTASVFAVRYARVQIVEKQTRRIVIPQGSLASQTFEKKQQSQSSSSSSSDED